jgi:hypothetical protein
LLEIIEKQDINPDTRPKLQPAEALHTPAQPQSPNSEAAPGKAVATPEAVGRAPQAVVGA